MSLFEIGRVVIKTSGRDSGNIAVIADVLEGNYALIDGNVRRKRCNVKHLEPLKETLKIKKNESHDNIIKAMKQAGIEIIERRIRSKSKGIKIRPKKTKKKKIAIGDRKGKSTVKGEEKKKTKKETKNAKGNK